MLIQCSISVQNLESQSNPPSLRSCVMTKKVNGIYYVCVKNKMYPNTKNYNIALLENIYCKFIKEKKIGLQFKEPKQVLLIVADDKQMLYMFYQQLRDIMNGKNVIIGTRQMPKAVPAKKNLINRFDPMSTEFVAIKRFDNRVLNMRHLSVLILEKCELPTMPVQIGHLPIKYLSISGSKLATTSVYERDTFWNWTSNNTICETLTTLKMDSIGLKKLPFEILFLRNLETLSAAKNKLTYLPHFLGELKKLKVLLVAQNMLVYFPYSLSSTTFEEMDISNNLFELPKCLLFNHLLKYLSVFEKLKTMDDDLNVKPLSNLSFYSLINNRVLFKRQDIPRTLWLYFDVVGRCILCRSCLLPDYSQVNHTHSLPTAVNLTKDFRTTKIPWQSLLCRVSCVGLNDINE